MSDNSWYEKGDNPPIGIICEKSYTSSKDLWSKVFIIGNKSDGGIVYEIIECPDACNIGDIRTAIGQYKVSGKWAGEVYTFRPIKTEREFAIEAAIKESNKTHFCHSHVKELAGIWFDAGLLRSKNES